MLIALVAVVMALGLVGTVVPMVPGLLIIWGAGLAYGLLTDFGAVGGVVFASMTLLLVGGQLAGYVLPHRAGARAGAARSSLWLGIALAVVGFFVVPVIGMVIGGVLGVYLGERQRLRDAAAAWDTTRQVLVGFGVGALVEVAAGVLMILLWVVWAVAG